ncbi:hypothetical protein B0H13DRAFT_1885436 [Mycena leptocephala]|nr:hypothetical protein B0H13DRAFT_1885436 [Mycena leptocephala]
MDLRPKKHFSELLPSKDRERLEPKAMQRNFVKKREVQTVVADPWLKTRQIQNNGEVPPVVEWVIHVMDGRLQSFFGLRQIALAPGSLQDRPREVMPIPLI